MNRAMGQQVVNEDEEDCDAQDKNSACDAVT